MFSRRRERKLQRLEQVRKRQAKHVADRRQRFNRGVGYPALNGTDAGAVQTRLIRQLFLRLVRSNPARLNPLAHGRSHGAAPVMDFQFLAHGSKHEEVTYLQPLSINIY
jgi:hypothetical protein